MKLQSKNRTVSVPVLYSFYFLTFEPAMALLGVYLCFNDPTQFAVRTNPHAYPPALPLTKHDEQMLVMIGSLYLFFSLTEGLALRSTRELGTWKAIFIAILASDIGHIYGLTMLGAGFGTLYQVWEFNADDCFNIGTLWAGALLRLFFILEIGFKRVPASAKANGKKASSSKFGDGLLW